MQAGDPIAALEPKLLVQMHRLMVLDRLLEERLIKMSKSGEGFFWIGDPGEEAFNIPLGLLVKKGHGLDYDFLHLHYRASGVLLAMGMDPIDALRQMRTCSADPFSKGRNFVNHYAVPKWNVVPIASTIETESSTSIGTAIAQRRHGGDGITIVKGGDAGTAEGDFHSCLVWSNRPGMELPNLILVVNNGWGISTPMRTQHGEKNISDWGKVFNMPAKTIDGNDPVKSYFAIKEAMAYVRKERKPYLLEAQTSRLYGHSSSSGANRINERDCIADFERALDAKGILNAASAQKVHEECAAQIDQAHELARRDSPPKPESIWDDIFSDGTPDSYPRGSF